MCVPTYFDYILTLTPYNNMFLQIKIFQLEQNRAILCLRAANASIQNGIIETLIAIIQSNSTNTTGTYGSG